MGSKETIRVFKGAVAIITGGASGIGRSLAFELSLRGCTVVIADLQIESAENIVTQIRKRGGTAFASELNVTDYSAVEDLIKNTVNDHGRIDYFFNNAGIMFMGDVDNYSIDDWNYTVDINLRGVINGVQAVYAVMSEQGFGHIVNTASMAGLIPTAGSISYATTKHAVVGLSRALLPEASAKNIRVSVFCPGIIRTPIMNGGKYGRDIQNLTQKQQNNFLESLEKIKPMDPDLFARRAVDSVAKNRFLIILPKWNRLFWLIDRLSPKLGQKFSQLGYENIKRTINN